MINLYHTANWEEWEFGTCFWHWTNRFHALITYSAHAMYQHLASPNNYHISHTDVTKKGGETLEVCSANPNYILRHFFGGVLVLVLVLGSGASFFLRWIGSTPHLDSSASISAFRYPRIL